MKTCPYCLAVVAAGDETVACESCGTPHHADCWAENGGCCVKDCPSVVRNVELDLPPPREDSLVLSKEAVESAVPRPTIASINPCIRCGRHVPEGELYCEECQPQRDPSPDASNVGPLLIVALIVALVIGWLIYLGVNSTPDTTQPSQSAPAGRIAR